MSEQGAMGGPTKSLGGRAPIARDRTGMLPEGAPLGFATLSHSNLKSKAQIAAAEGHNTRSKNTPNAREGAPKPIELLSEKSGSYLDRVNAILAEHGEPAEHGRPARPVKPRKGGTIACEDVYGASPEYWNRDGDWKLKSVEELEHDPVVQAAVALARRKHGRRLVSCSLHLDEESPHIHVISVPLVKREHSKRGRKPKGTPRDSNGKPLEDNRPKVEKWTLDVSSMRGRSSDLEKNHDEWAEICAPFGLVRGSKGSEMSEEERRARRNRQTGRSSMAEKVAREERERLHEEAERSRKQALDYEAKAKAKDRESEANRIATAQEREAAEAAAARAKAQEMENERTRRELEEKEDDLTRRTAEFNSFADTQRKKMSSYDDQMRLISRILDPSNPCKVLHRNGRLESEGLDQRDRDAARSSWAWLSVGLEAFVKRFTNLVDREARMEDRERKVLKARKEAEDLAAEVAAERAAISNERQALELAREDHRLQFSILQKAGDPRVGVTVTPDAEGNCYHGLTDAEKAVVFRAPHPFRENLRKLAVATHLVAAQTKWLLRREKAVEAQESAIARKASDIERIEAELRDDERYLDEIFGAVERTCARASTFLNFYKRLPVEMRSPSLTEANQAAEEFSQEELRFRQALSKLGDYRGR